MNDDARADEADAAHDRRREQRRVVIVGTEGVRHHRERGGAEGDESVGLDAGVLMTPLALDADDRAEDEGETDSEDGGLRIDQHAYYRSIGAEEHRRIG